MPPLAMNKLFDRVINEAMTPGFSYRQSSPEVKTAFRDYKSTNPAVSVVDFVAGWNACMEYLRTNTNVFHMPGQEGSSPLVKPVGEAVDYNMSKVPSVLPWNLKAETEGKLSPGNHPA